MGQNNNHTLAVDEKNLKKMQTSLIKTNNRIMKSLHHGNELLVIHHAQILIVNPLQINNEQHIIKGLTYNCQKLIQLQHSIQTIQNKINYLLKNKPSKELNEYGK